MKCPQCNTEIQRLTKRAGGAFWFVFVIFLVLFMPVSFLMLIIYLLTDPDRCPVCGESLKIATVNEDGVYVKKFVKKGWLD